MVKLNDKRYIIYNDNKTIIVFSDNRESDIPSCVEYFDNKQGFDNKYLEQNINKKLSFKDKMVVLYQKSPFCNSVDFDNVFCGHIFKTQQCTEQLEPKFKEIYDTLQMSIGDGVVEYSGIGHTTNFYAFYCSNNDVEELFENFRKLEEKHIKQKEENLEEQPEL